MATKNKAPLAVDLGLTSGTLWADRNIGAENETDAGIYLAWGETAEKEGYYLSNYKFWQNVKVGEHEETTGEGDDAETTIIEDYEYKMVKYNGEDGKKSLEAEDDAANVLMGEGWAMPTAEQWQELFDECDVRVLDESVRFSKNGKSIVLPRCGVMYQDMKPVELPSRCNYWSKDKERDEHNAIRAIVDVTGNSATTYMDWENRISGMPIRAIKNV